MDIETIRLSLREHRGQWSRIAVSAGISRKTIERLMADAEYNPTVATLKAIAAALPTAERHQEAPGAPVQVE
jgi:DNA-binding phage protein